MTQGVPAFKDAARFRSGFNRQAGAARLQTILDKRGQLDVDGIIRDARRLSSPLHDAFIWDADEALRDSHDHTARYLLRNFVTVTIKDDETRDEARAVLPVFTSEEADTRSYVSTDEAMANLDYRGQVLQQAKDELRSFQRRYASLKELAKVFAAIKALDSAGDKKAA